MTNWLKKMKSENTSEFNPLKWGSRYGIIVQHSTFLILPYTEGLYGHNNEWMNDEVKQ